MHETARSLAIFLVFVAFVVISVATARPAQAGDESVDLTVEQGLAYHGKRSVSEMPFHLRGAEHPEVIESFGSMKTTRSTRGIGRSAEHACSIAFQSAIIQLQARSLRLGGNAVVDIVSIVDGREVEIPGGFRCRVGNIVATVRLTARAVELAH